VGDAPVQVVVMIMEDQEIVKKLDALEKKIDALGVFLFGGFYHDVLDEIFEGLDDLFEKKDRKWGQDLYDLLDDDEQDDEPVVFPKTPMPDEPKCWVI